MGAANGSKGTAVVRSTKACTFVSRKRNPEIDSPHQAHLAKVVDLTSVDLRTAIAELTKYSHFRFASHEEDCQSLWLNRR